MVERLPEYIDPLYLADKRAELKGQILLSKFDRLGDLLCDDSGVVAVELVFAREGRYPIIEGQFAAASLILKCQNCLQGIRFPVQGQFKLGIVNSIEQADRLPEEYEPLLIGDEQKILLRELIEDELLLALPAIPKHQQACYPAEYLADKTILPTTTKTDATTENPFSILAHLKNIGEP